MSHATKMLSHRGLIPAIEGTTGYGHARTLQASRRVGHQPAPHRSARRLSRGSRSPVRAS